MSLEQGPGPFNRLGFGIFEAPLGTLGAQARALGALTMWDLRQRVAGSWLGLGWLLIQPAVRVAIQAIVFLGIMGVRPMGSWKGVPPWAWILSGFLPWLWFAEALGRAPTLIWERDVMVRSQRFPLHLLAPMNLLSSAASHLVALAVFGAVLSVTVGLPLHVLWQLPIEMFLCGALGMGFGWILCGLGVPFRDMVPFSAMALNVWAYLTPLAYPIEMVPARWQFWFRLNPLTQAAEGYRNALLGQAPLPFQGTLILTAWAAGICVLGLLLFQRLRPRLAERL
jgi:lipopolysaccharide transport system permease protein